MYICVCPNQDRGPIRVTLPIQLIKKWAKHIGDDIPRKQYQYCVASAVRQEAKSTREHFLKCWSKYKRRANDEGQEHFLKDVYNRFCDADFGNKKGDNSKSKSLFVHRILRENNGDDLEPPQVLSCECYVCW